MLRRAESVIATLAATVRGYATPTFLRRVGRYAAVGLVVSIFYSILVIAFVHSWPLLSPTLASVIAFIVTLPAAYFVHRNITFFDRQRDAFQPLRFAVTTATSFILAIGGMYWITAVAGRSFLLGIAWNWLTIPAVNFLVYILWVFRASHTAAPAGHITARSSNE